MQGLVKAATVTLLGLAAFPASAQIPPPPSTAISLDAVQNSVVALRRLTSPRVVVDRFLSFDADGDDRVTAAELPERMRGLVDRIDRDDDGFMTKEEIQGAVDVAPPQVQRTSVLPKKLESGVLGAIQDLKLPPPKHERAMALLPNYKVPQNLNNSNSLDLPTLHAALKEVLDEDEFLDFLAATARPDVRRVFSLSTSPPRSAAPTLIAR